MNGIRCFCGGEHSYAGMSVRTELCSNGRADGYDSKGSNARQVSMAGIAVNHV